MVALGVAKESEYADGIHILAKRLRGQSGLLFTNESKRKVLKFARK